MDSGNTVDGTGALLEACLGATYGILGHDIATNESVVGNWDITDTPELSYASRTGPTEDGRLKPDVIAPGSEIETIEFDPDSGVVSAISFGGTSAATPVATGIAGWVLESLSSAASAHAVKGTLLHTALDVGPTGPDFRHGYGVVLAAPAVRIAREWSSYGLEGTTPDIGGTSCASSILALTRLATRSRRPGPSAAAIL